MNIEMLYEITLNDVAIEVAYRIARETVETVWDFPKNMVWVP